MFINADNQPINLRDFYRNRSAFLLCGGPSLADLSPTQRAQLQLPGALTMAVNNAARVLRPNLWCCVDDPDHFIRSIFLDPRIIKFLPQGKRDRAIFDSDRWTHLPTRVADCPAVVYYRLTHDGFPDRFLDQDSFFWGYEAGRGGGRSVMHVAPKILYVLGIRRIFLLGADFHMSDTHRYAFAQDRAPGSVKGNNATYAQLNERFAILRPQFEAAGLFIFNCTPGSQLTAFDRLSLDDAFALVRDEFNVDVEHERTFGLYERASKSKQIDKWRGKADAALQAAEAHVTKAVNHPGVERFARRAKRHVARFFKDYRRLVQHENEAEALRLWRDAPLNVKTT